MKWRVILTDSGGWSDRIGRGSADGHRAATVPDRTPPETDHDALAARPARACEVVTMDDMNESRFLRVESFEPIWGHVAPRVTVVRVVYPRSWLRRLLHLPARYGRYSVPEDLD